jgi:uncharacterized membrane protein
MPEFRTHYNHLKIEEDASIEDIRAAFKAYFLKFHPNKHGGNKQRAKQVMLIVSEAYSILSNPQKRADYDSWIAKNRQNKEQELIGRGELKKAQKFEGRAPEIISPVADKKLSVWKMPVLILVLVGLGYAGWLIFNQENFSTPILSRIIDSPNANYGFVFENKCKHPITLLIRYKGLDGDWYFGGWWDVDSGALFYLQDENGKRLTSRSPIWYYYARTTNDAGLEWKGSNRFTYGGTRLPMIEIEDNGYDSEWSISCD